MTWHVEFRGSPRADLVETFHRSGLLGCSRIGGPWSLIARDGDRCLVAVDAFAGEPLFVDPAGRAVDPDRHRGPMDPRAVAQHLDARIDDPRITWFKDVIRVPAGWGGPPDALGPIWWPLPRVVERPAAALHEALLGSVVHLIGSSKPDLALSGGLDSSVLATLLPGIRGLRNAFPGWACDEAVFADAVAARLDIRVEAVDSREKGPGDLEEVFAPPHFPPMFVNHYLNLALMQQSRGALCTGFGGDEVIGHGGSVLEELGSLGQHRKVWSEALSLVRFSRIRPEHWARRLRRHGSGAVRATLGRMGRRSPRERRRRSMTHPFLQISREEQLGMARRSGVRLTQPFLDAELAALMLSIPDVERVKRGLTRWVLRQAFWDDLPEPVRSRADKADLRRAFDEPARLWLEGVWPTIISGVLDPWRSEFRLNALRRGFLDRDDHLAGAELWRAYGAARWLSWHAVEGMSR